MHPRYRVVLTQSRVRSRAGSSTKHIKAKFFFIKDRVDDGEIKVVDCPTEEMWADIMTKPLQGAAFRVMRAELMNCNVNYEDPPEKEESGLVAGPKTVSCKSVISTAFKTPQECVGQNRNLGTVRRGDTRWHHTVSNGSCVVAQSDTPSIWSYSLRMPEQSLGVERLRTLTW